jgi:uncharacterized membrane protein YfcA
VLTRRGGRAWRSAPAPATLAPVLHHLAVFAAGFGSGFLNVMAGGGSLLTLPLLIFLGLPVAVANGTNRVAIVVQNAAAVAAFRRQGERGIREGLGWAFATVPGAVVGAWLAVRVDERLFRALLAGVLVLGVIGLVAPTGRGPVTTVGPWRRAAALLALVGIGFYGGFVQAGVGFLLMLVLHQIVGLDLIRTNVHKVLIVLVFSLPALAVFVVSGNVAWPAAVVLSAGNALGAVVATRVTITGGDRPIRIVVGLTLLLMAARLAGAP